MINPEGENLYDYYRNGLLKAVDYASGAEADYTYDAADRIDTITNRHNGAVVSFYDYDYDDNGNRTRQIEENGFGVETTTYAFDEADRLTTVTYPDSTEAYTYDAAWNRITETVTEAGGPVSDKTLTYNDRHQLTEIQDSVDAANDAVFGYDDNGNQTRKVKGGVTTDFVYDVRDNLRSVITGGSTVGQFLYDYRGMRTEKQGERGVERYTRDDESVLFQADGGDTVTARFEYGPNRLLSLKQPNLPSEFYLFDALRSPVTLVRKDGSISARYAYDAWGEKRHESRESFNRFGFTGHEHDEETGLIYAKARYYDPEIARFLSEDPFAGKAEMPPSLHKYLYAYQNPTVYIDPDGRLPCAGACITAVGLGVLAGTVSDFLFSDRTERVREQIQPESALGEFAATGVAFSQSATNTVSLGLFDAGRRSGVEGQLQHARDLVGETDLRRAYSEFTSENGDPVLGTLHGIKGTAQATETVLAGITGFRSRMGWRTGDTRQRTVTQNKSKPATRTENRGGESNSQTGRAKEKNKTAAQGKSPTNRNPDSAQTDNETGFQEFHETRAETAGRIKFEAEEKARKATRDLRPDPNAHTLETKHEDMAFFERERMGREVRELAESPSRKGDKKITALESVRRAIQHAIRASRDFEGL